MNKIPLLIVLVAVAAKAHIPRHPRFFGLSSLFGHGTEEKATDLPTLPDLSGHPVWKVHKYNGITILPVPVTSEAGQYYPPSQKETYGPPTETYGPPPQTYGPPPVTYSPPAETYGPPPSTYDTPPETYDVPADTSGGSDVSESLDALGSLASLLPDEPSSGGSTKGSNTNGHGYLRTILDTVLNAKSNLGGAISGLAAGKKSAIDLLSPSHGGASSPDTASLLLGLLSQYPQIAKHFSHGGSSSTDTASLLLGLVSQYPQFADYFSRIHEDEGYELPSLPDLPALPAILGLDKIPKLPKIPLIKIPKHPKIAPYAPAMRTPAPYSPPVPESTYGAPPEESFSSYPTASTGPYPPALPQSSYGTPEAPSSSYEIPPNPSELPTTYDTPPAPYEPTPYAPPEPTYEVPEEPQSPYPASFNPPQPEPMYGPPESTYGAPEPTFRVEEQSSYSPPEPQPTYGVPEQPQRPNPALYSPPASELTPAAPRSSYQQPPAPSSGLVPPSSQGTPVVPPESQETHTEVAYKAVPELPVAYQAPTSGISWAPVKETDATPHTVVYESVPGRVTTIIYPQHHYEPDYTPPILESIRPGWERSSDSNQEILTSESSKEVRSASHGFFPLDPDYLPPFLQYRDEQSAEGSSKEVSVSKGKDSTKQRGFPVSQANSEFSNRFRGKVHMARGEVIVDTPTRSER